MNFIQRNQTVIIFLFIVGALFFGYQYFFSAPQEGALNVTNVQAAGSEADQELIALLLELKGIRLDNAIFTDTTFQSLTDFSKELVTEPIGRVNPFAPIDASQGKTTGTTQGKTTR